MKKCQTDLVIPGAQQSRLGYTSPSQSWTRNHTLYYILCTAFSSDETVSHSRGPCNKELLFPVSTDNKTEHLGT
jgi:hypothetical protein